MPPHPVFLPLLLKLLEAAPMAKARRHHGSLKRQAPTARKLEGEKLKREKAERLVAKRPNATPVASAGAGANKPSGA